MDEPLRLAALRRLNLIETPLENRFERITRVARRALNMEVAAISLVETDRQWFKSAQGHSLRETSREISFCGHTLLQGEPSVIKDARLDPRFARNPLVIGPMQCIFYAGQPIRSPDGYNIGAFCVCDSKPRELTEEDLQILRDLAGWTESELRLASANAVQASLIEDVSVEHRRGLIDGLTRMWNRDGILRLAHHCAESSSVRKTGFALIMVDLDHFKEINDVHGHGAGDEVLRVCARRMLGAVRETDSIGRRGGDEFIIVVTQCESEQAANTVAQRVCSAIKSSPIRTTTATIPVSASLGVRFVAHEEANCIDEILEDADQALYRAKDRGRDTVVLAL